MSTPPIVFMHVACLPAGREEPVFHDLDLVVDAGRIAVLVSPLGGGKTSALRLAVGLERPSAGVVRICGHDPASCPREVRARIGYAPAEGALLSNLSLWDNLVLPLRYFCDPDAAEVQRRATAALALFGLGELPRLAPAAAPTNLRRLVALARAMILDPQVLVIDDPSDDFDEDSSHELWGHLADIARAQQVAILAAATRAPDLPDAQILRLGQTTQPVTRRFSSGMRRSAVVPALKAIP
jgi:ABC-type multidrug transport system ATPase subunit